MISYRQADLAKRLLKNEEEFSKPKVGDKVYVEAAHPDDSWGGAFYGSIQEVSEVRALVADYGGNRFWVSNGRFKVIGKDHPANIVGCHVDVHDPTQYDDWNNEFRGMIVGLNSTNDIFEIEDQEENIYRMKRDKFDVVD